MKKHILVLLTVVALMAVMMVVTVAPVFAERPPSAGPPPFHPTAPANQAYHNPSDPVSNCAADPVCSEADVGQHHFDEGFPPGQPPGPPEE